MMSATRIRVLALCLALAGAHLALTPEDAMSGKSRSQAPPDLGAGQRLDPSIRIDDVIALWGCATRRQEVPDIPGAEGRTVLSYRFPTKRLIGLYEEGPEPTPRPMSALAFHFDKRGALIFFEELEEGNTMIAIGGNLLGIEIKAGPGHYRDKACD